MTPLKITPLPGCTPGTAEKIDALNRKLGSFTRSHSFSTFVFFAIYISDYGRTVLMHTQTFSPVMRHGAIVHIAPKSRHECIKELQLRELQYIIRCYDGCYGKL